MTTQLRVCDRNGGDLPESLASEVISGSGCRASMQPRVFLKIDIPDSAEDGSNPTFDHVMALVAEKGLSAMQVVGQ